MPLSESECREVRQFCEAKANDEARPIYWDRGAMDVGSQAFHDVISGVYIFTASDVGMNMKTLGAREVNTASQAYIGLRSAEARPQSSWDGTFQNAELKNMGAKIMDIQWVRDRV